ncbi:carboxymuconolactone decarboxylase family protein [Streptomyces sp. NPDC059009]|uniref:carboxymuconolactone decarboxylase family protein n=1 Tax=Streptomyces sp. NPDC059009 TaxID=3346694 RepID=UPI003682E527
MGFEELHERGRDTFAGLIPGGKEQLDAIMRAAPALGEMAVGAVYGHLHHRPALDPRMREAAALAAILASGMYERPLAVHLRTGLAAGLAPGEIAEVLLETAAFAGFPRAVSALPTIEAAFRGADVPLPPPPAPREVALAHLEAEGIAADGAKVVAVGPDEVVVVFTAEEAEEAEVTEKAEEGGAPTRVPSRVPARVLHLRIDGDRVAGVTWLTP